MLANLVAAAAMAKCIISSGGILPWNQWADKLPCNAVEVAKKRFVLKQSVELISSVDREIELQKYKNFRFYTTNFECIVICIGIDLLQNWIHIIFLCLINHSLTLNDVFNYLSLVWTLLINVFRVVQVNRRCTVAILNKLSTWWNSLTN